MLTSSMTNEVEFKPEATAIELVPQHTTYMGRIWKGLNSCSNAMQNNAGLLKAGVLTLMIGAVAATEAYELVCSKSSSEDIGNSRSIHVVFPYKGLSIPRTEGSERIIQFIEHTLSKAPNPSDVACQFVSQLVAYKGNLSDIVDPCTFFNITITSSAIALTPGTMVALVSLITSIAVVVLNG